MIRLQKYLADCGIASRRSAEKLILQGRVSVNGIRVLELGSKIFLGVDEVRYDGKPVTVEKKKLYLFHKPTGVITTLEDPQKRRSLKEFVKDLPVRVFPVGRLDQDVSGLLLLTNDGFLADRLLHPRHQVIRTYLALIRGNPSSQTLSQLVKGVTLSDGPGKAVFVSKLRPSRTTTALFGVIPKESCLIEVGVGEGRNHFVKNIFATIGFPVIMLVRVAFGPYKLGKLGVGEIREVRIAKHRAAINGIAKRLTANEH